jgi:opacity protein-like surface antigen
MKTVSALRRLLGAASAALLLNAAPAGAQDATAPPSTEEGKVRLYAGYAYFRADDGNLHGLRLSPEYRLNGFASIVGDFSVEKGTIDSSDTTLTTYLGGIRVKRGIGPVSVFLHALAGGARTSSSISPFGGVTISVADSGLALDGGGGIEFKVTNSVKLRVGADYLRRKIDVGNRTENQDDMRATVGVVF